MQHSPQSQEEGSEQITAKIKDPAELLWVSSSSLLTAANSCNDVAMQANLYQYRSASTSEPHKGCSDGELADLRRRLETAKENIDLAIDAIEEFHQQTE